MTTPAKILIVEDDPDALRAFRRVLAGEGRFDLYTASDGMDGFNRALKIIPDLIISDFQMPGLNGFEFCQRIKSHPELNATMFVLVTVFHDTPLKVRGLNLGVDDYLAKPVDAPELIAKVRSVLRIKQLHDQLRSEKESLQNLHQELSQSCDRLISVLTAIMDLSVPGAEDKGRKLAALVSELATDFDVPDRFIPDLRFAAQLQEIGKVADGRAPAQCSHQSPADWRYILVSEAILQEVDRFKEAAELVGAIYENWDGTGLPNHLKQGQIPLRSRLLRTSIDLLDAIEKLPDTDDRLETALEQLSRGAGTRYDPVVVTKLSTLARGKPRLVLPTNRLRVPIAKLQEGMVLAADLLTSSGVKLLARGACLTRGTIDVILKRHQIDPIIYGAWVAR